MTSWTHLVRFTATEDNAIYYTKCDSTLPQVGAQVPCFKSITSLDICNVTSDLKTIKEVIVQENPSGVALSFFTDTCAGGTRFAHCLHRIELCQSRFRGKGISHSLYNILKTFQADQHYS